MSVELAVVVTSIQEPTPAVREIARYCTEKPTTRFLMIGDKKGPGPFTLDGCDFYSLERQLELPLDFSRACPTGHYARKNIGYLLAMRERPSRIVETDDDNFPTEEFWAERTSTIEASVVIERGWINVYQYFSRQHIWPRGLALEAIQRSHAPLETLERATCFCPIQQALADDNPDVDAIYRLTLPLPVRFEINRTVALGEGRWCPFNSQATTWFPDAYPLMYLPSYCSFRMTDIWRSFVAQRIAWANDWSIAFHSPTVEQERNDHSLLKDFEEEIPGYLHNQVISELLSGLTLRRGSKYIAENLIACYETLVDADLIGRQELPLLRHWLESLPPTD